MYYLELGIFFNLYVYYLTRVFIGSNRAFNFLTHGFNLENRVLESGFDSANKNHKFE